MKRWAEVWSSFPAAHKKRCYQGLAGYGLLMALTAAWISVRAADTLKTWQASQPFASVAVKNVYLTPQITNAMPAQDRDAANHTSAPEYSPRTPLPAADDGKTYISIIVSGVGLSSLATQRAIDDLPPQITLAFSPYADNVQSWIRKALSEHHETLMLLPMEPLGYMHNDPGPRALSTDVSDADNNDNLKWMLNAGEGSDGVMNMMGSRFLTDQQSVTSAFSILRKNDEIFVETPDIDKSAAADVASKLGLPYMEANLRIDTTATDSSIHAQLNALEQQAHQHGYAIGIAQPYPLTMNILKTWAAGLAARGIVLAPLKTVWKNKPHYEDNSAPSQSQLRQP